MRKGSYVFWFQPDGRPILLGGILDGTIPAGTEALFIVLPLDPFWIWVTSETIRIGIALMLLQALADLVLLIHIGFIIFVLFGGILTIWWRWVPWVHLPAALWAAALEFGGWICPLTPLENRLRQASGEAGYAGGFLEHYALPVIYPQGLTSEIQLLLGFVVVLMTLWTYGVVWWRKTRHAQSPRH